MDRRTTRTRRAVLVKDEAPDEEEWVSMAAPGPSKAVYGARIGRPPRRVQNKVVDLCKADPEEDVVTDAAPEADESEDGEEEEEEDEDSDDSDEGTYFIDQAGNYYYQATPDSDPVLTDPPKGKYVPEDDTAKTGENGISYVLIVDEPSEGVQEKMESGEKKTAQTVYTIDSGNGKNFVIEEEDEMADENAEMVEVNTNVVLQEKEAIKAPTRVTKTRVKSEKKAVAAGATPQVEFNCSYCNYMTLKRHLLARHMKCHSDERPYKCVVCERGFKTMASLNNHVNTHTGTKPHHCKHCKNAFTTSGELVRHIRYKHTREKPHKCPDCDYASVELSKLRRHIRCHTGERPYQCPHCTYASPDTFKLKRHLRTHTGEKPYVCDICQARFTQSNSMKAHKLIHNVGDKPMFKCDFCPTTCGRKTDLRIHVQKLHTADNPLLCQKCNQSFPDRYTYKTHMKTHEGEKCFKCDYCSYRTGNVRQLETHILVHTDEKPFQCSDCDQSFRQKQLLKRHVNLYHNPSYVPPKPRSKTHQCPTCGRGFHHKGNLMRHMTVHDPDQAGQLEASRLKAERKMKIPGTANLSFADNYNFSEYEEEFDDEDEDEEEEEEVGAGRGLGQVDDGGGVPVEHEDEDGNRYVVLEVIDELDV